MKGGCCLTIDSNILQKAIADLAGHE